MITVKYLKDDAPTDLRWMLREESNAPPAYLDALRLGWYVDAALIDGDDLERAYMLLQNGMASDSWTLNPPDGLTPLLKPIEANGQRYGNRSAMIGDIFVIGAKLFVCATAGFQELPVDPPQTHVLGSGIFSWQREERVSNRYGAFCLDDTNYHQDVTARVVFNSEAIRAAGLVGTRVKIMCTVIESRPSGHIGDKALDLQPTQPEVGECIELGVGVLNIDAAYRSVELRPEVARDELWIDPRRLYRLHDQTVTVTVVQTHEACTPQAALTAETGTWSNGDNTIQTKRVNIETGAKVMPRVRALGGGMFEISTDFGDGDQINLLLPIRPEEPR